ncbi:histone-binding protein N1/N2 isoform X3 [Cydia strobilella]|uniref:histone-binding protein N1/N2 isoform X3 n=1 Tax=Cydia strobilella TaxID=1100964 RepID=UPI003006CC55
MADVEEVTQTPSELLASGRRNLAVRDYNAATEALAKACELLAKEHGDTADQCAEAYLWYGKALLGLSREESGVLGDGMPGTGNADGEEDDDNEENGENGEEENGEAEAEPVKAEADDGVKKSEAESTTKDEPASSSTADDQPGPSNGEAADESMADLENEDDVDNLQLAWEMLDLARSILRRRAEGGGAARAQLADVYLALGEVALESETYDKAVVDMQSCLEIQKELYNSDDRRIAETHYQIGLANSLASNFEDAITHFKNAANILETRIKTLENPATVKDDATVKKHSTADPFYSVEGEIKELKELLPEIQEKIQDMMDYKTETKKRLTETLFSSNGESSHLNGAGSSSSEAKPKPAASDISHLIKRKRKSSEGDEASSAKRANT